MSFHLNAQAMFWRKTVHDKFSGFDINLSYTMDYQMIVEFGLIVGQSNFLRIPFSLGAFRRYEGQKTAGFDRRVLEEHKSIASTYGFLDKYNIVGSVLRYLYRFRRAYWYLKRGGIVNLYRRFIASFESSYQRIGIRS